MDFATIRQKPWRAAAAAAGVLLLLAAGGVAVIAVTAPPVESLRDYRPPQASLVFDRDGLQKTTYWDIPLDDNPLSERNADEWAEWAKLNCPSKISAELREKIGG